MKFSIKRSELIKRLSDVQLAISAKTTIPILTGVKLQLTNNQLILTGSDADISIESTLVADENNQLQIEEEGSIVVQPARMLVEIIRKLPDDIVHLELAANQQISVESDTSSFVINGIEADQYPHLPNIDTSTNISLPIDLLKQVIKQTVIAVSHHESRPILTGVHFKIEGQQLTAVATDSHRLSKRVISLDQAVDQNYEFVIPGKSLTELNRLMEEEEESIDLYVTENQVLFSLSHTHFYSRLLEGNYPNTDQLIPTDSNTQIELQAQQMQAAVDRASLLSHAGKNNVIKMIVTQDQLEINGNYPDIGKIEEEIPFESINGSEIEISFNPDYMKQALNAFGPIDVQIELVGALRPFVIRPANGSDDFVQLITPIRTPD